MAHLAPIAIFAYSRVDALARLLESLQKCPEFKDSPLHIFVDGPAKVEMSEKVEAVCLYVKNFSHERKTLHISKENKGLARAIFSGVSEICEKYGKCIVLEDDLIVSSHVLTYFNQALEKYKDDMRICSVQAYTFFCERLKSRKEAVLLPYTHPWGWATWQRSWKDFDLYMAVNEEILESQSFKKQFNASGLDNVALMKLAAKKMVNSWYVKWLYHAVLKGYFSVYPPQTLVLNYGLTKGGTHSSGVNPTALLLGNRDLQDSGLPIFSEKPNIDYVVLDIISRSWEIKTHRVVAFLGRIKRYLKKYTKLF